MLRTRLNKFLPLAILPLLAQLTWAGDGLSFFNNWFVTGDYAVAGVGLRGTGINGWATGAINMTAVPAGAEPIAAFLYWSTVESTTTPSARVGYFNGHEIQGDVLGNAQNPNPPCWSSGGTSAPRGTTGLSYRADVLRYLPVDANNTRQANGAQTVKLPDSGGGGNGNVLFTNGASLVVIYRIVVPGNPKAAPLKAVVIYNGAFTLSKSSVTSLTQNVAGFYQAPTGADIEMTNIVANGQASSSSSLSVNGAAVNPNNLFSGVQGTRWDNPVSNFSLSAEASNFQVQLAVNNNQTCLTSVAIIASMSVKDTDNDGLLDIWETSGLHRNTQASPATFGTCSDYPGEPCVNLPLMGANPNVPDIFIQIDWMHGSGDGTGGTDGRGTHDHMPTLAALSAVACTFAVHGIDVHFDVGGNYQGAACSAVSPSFIVPTAYTQGGSDINESSLVCQDSAKHPCDYHTPYPVLSFEYGFASVRDGNQLLGIPAHFAQNRKDIFRYALFAHTLAGPFNINGQPIDPVSGQPTTVPRSYSGIAHRPGGGLMVTFGLWRSDLPANDQVGSPQAQAGTLMHELGHNLGLSHAGLVTQPNCMPNYPSVMNYLYQTRGLTDAQGNEHVDYSNGFVGLLNETAPANSLTGLSYRLRFYAPLAPGAPADSAAQLHCDGTPITSGVPEVRTESATVAAPDWSNGSGLTPPFDLNYNGVLGETFADQPDWTSLNLQQIGTGYSFGGMSAGAFATDGGVYATDGGAFATDAGALATDGGVFATDGGAFATDAGAFATDGGVFATDGGAFATDGGAFATDAGDLDYNTQILSSVDAPGSLATTDNIGSISLNWVPPSLGNIPSYNIYRCAGAVCTPAPPAFKNITGSSTSLNFIDSVNDFVDSGAACPSASTCYNTSYTYAVTSQALVNSNLIESGLSNTASGIVEHLFITANDKSRPYESPNPPLDFSSTGLDVATLAAGAVTCTTMATQSSSVGTYPITCGPLPATTSNPVDGITYTAGTLTITKANATITVTPYNVTYDANPHTAAGKATGLNGENLSAGLDLSGTTHTNAGTYNNDPWTFTDPSGNYNSANGAVNDNIARAVATIVVVPYNVTYDANSHSATGTATGVRGVILSAADLNLSGTTHTNAGTYNNDPWNFSDPNYFPTNGVVSDHIAQATATISVTPYNIIYDGKAHTATGTATGVGGANLIADLNLSGTTHTNVGTYNNDPWTFTDPNGNYKTASGLINDAIVWKFALFPLKSPAKLGSSVPINWTLQDASGNYITSMSTLVKLESVFNGPAPAGGCVASLSGIYQPLYSLPNGSTGNSSFRYSSSFTFNWDSGAATTGTGCYTVKITLNDGTAKMTNAVQLK